MKKEKKKVGIIQALNILAANERRKIVFFTAFSFAVNLIYVIYNAYMGLKTDAAWFFTMCVYYLMLSCMRGYAVFAELRIKRDSGMNDTYNAEKRVMKTDGILIMLLVIALSGTVVLTVAENRVVTYDTITMITIAAFTFYKIIAAIVNAVKIRKHNSPIFTTIRNISLVDAVMSVLPMQTSMIGSFGGDDGLPTDYLRLMTIMTGTGICVVMLIIAVTMLFSGNGHE